jgi:heme/copper-type cytochrome/quinol oxidase subunit 2
MNPNEQPPTQTEVPAMPPTPPSVAAPAPEAPATAQAPVAPAQPVANEDPGKTLGIVGLILAILFPLVGFIVSLIARSKSKKAGHSNTPAIIGIIISVILFVIQTIVVIAMVAAIASVVQKCSELGPGTHVVGGTTYECGN